MSESSFYKPLKRDCEYYQAARNIRVSTHEYVRKDASRNEKSAFVKSSIESVDFGIKGGDRKETASEKKPKKAHKPEPKRQLSFTDISKKKSDSKKIVKPNDEEDLEDFSPFTLQKPQVEVKSETKTPEPVVIKPNPEAKKNTSDLFQYDPETGAIIIGTIRREVIKDTDYDSKISWTEKHCPKSLSEFVGNEKQIAEIKTWLANHASTKPGTKLGLMLIGPSGCGKTILASLVPKHLGYQVQEFNTVTVVTGKREKVMKKGNPNSEASIIIDGVIPAMVRNNFGKPHVVVLDQVEDMGTAAELKPLWKTSDKKDSNRKPLHGILQPVQRVANAKSRKKEVKGDIVVASDSIAVKWPAPLIMTVNDAQATSIYDLKNATIRGADSSIDKKDKTVLHIVYMDHIPLDQIKRRLEYICKQEKIVSCEIEMIARCSMGDMRKAIILLQESCRKLDGRKMIPSEVKLVCTMFTSSNMNESYREKQYQENNESRKKAHEKLKDHIRVGPESVKDEDEVALYIPDMGVQDLMEMIIRERNTRESLEQHFRKMCTPFLETVTRVNIPKYISATEERHPYLYPVDLKGKGPNSEVNAMDTMAQIADHWSLGDIYNREGGWKKTEMFDYYINHMYVAPAMLVRKPKKNKRPSNERFYMDWIGTKLENGRASTLRSAHEHMRKVRFALGYSFSETDVLMLAETFRIISEKWHQIKFVESITPNLDVVLAAYPTKFNLQASKYWSGEKTFKAHGDDLEEVLEAYDVDSTNPVEMISAVVKYANREQEETEEIQPYKKRKTTRKQAKNILDMDKEDEEEFRKRCGNSYRSFARFMILIGFDPESLESLAYFTGYGNKDVELEGRTIEGRVKEIGKGPKNHPSLAALMTQELSALEKQGIVRIVRATSSKIISKETAQEEKINMCIENTKKQKPRLGIADYPPVNQMFNAVFSRFATQGVHGKKPNV